jgi:hypothetical protein
MSRIASAKATRLVAPRFLILKAFTLYVRFQLLRVVVRRGSMENSTRLRGLALKSGPACCVTFSLEGQDAGALRTSGGGMIAQATSGGGEDGGR